VKLEDVTARVRRRRLVRAGALDVAVGCLVVGAVITVQVAEGSSSHPTGRGAGTRASASAPMAAAPPTASPPAAAPTAPTCVATSPPDSLGGDTRSCQYVGLTLEAARAQAATEHRDLQVISQDGVSAGPFTYEFRSFRVRVTVVKDRVTSAFIG
jgi:hypothetical protein